MDHLFVNIFKEHFCVEFLSIHVFVYLILGKELCFSIEILLIDPLFSLQEFLSLSMEGNVLILHFHKSTSLHHLGMLSPLHVGSILIVNGFFEGFFPFRANVLLVLTLHHKRMESFKDKVYLVFKNALINYRL